MDIKKLLNSKLGDWPELELYIKIITENKNSPKMDGLTEAHHILPKSIFPEFSNLRKNPWNKINLSFYKHLEAHYYLCCSGHYKMVNTFKLMSNIDNLNLSKSELENTLKWFSMTKALIFNETSKKSKENWADADFRNKTQKSIAVAMKTNKVRNEISKSLSEMWENPTFKDERSQAIKSGKRDKHSVPEFGMFSLNGELIKTFTYVPDVKEALCRNISTSSIHGCLNGKFKTAYNYIWRYL